ncbi:hypothetical protein GJU40_13980 [Bacillus lacus]|uniref:CobW C-terminal domain-containing protein n=1 Tax=Metabacillus lacus TaxID=1983721 RepID=A0A7X2M0K0_9BACI|nr:GTP-binding protein [Metabacillus lacus]MRX73252.1 hypothetical protein [Metabacillus lacus]
MRRKIPVYVISGFLGSGKTTVLLRLIQEYEKMKKTPGIILNELGETNMEAHYFHSHKIKELLNGCICCSIQDDLKETLRHFSVLDADVLFIEGTGVANPNEIKDLLLSPEFLEIYDLQSVIGMADAGNFLEYNSWLSSTSQVRKLLAEQVACSDLLILNKTDLVDERKLKKIEGKIHGMLPDTVPVFRTEYAKIPADILLRKRHKTAAHIQNDGGGTVKQAHHHHHHHHSEINALKIEARAPVNRTLFEKWFERLPEEVLRAKGVITFKGTPGTYEFQYASGKLSLKRMKEPHQYNPAMIVIGEKLKHDELLTSFHSICLNAG